MFDSLSDRLGATFDRLRGRGALTESDVQEALREVRIALLEADVALPVAKSFVASVRERAVGQEVLRSIKPGQQVVKIVHDVLVETLGGEEGENDLNLAKAPPVPILMVGLQGSGKTTSTAKIAMRLQKREKKRVLMASLDTRRPAAMEQLAVLGEQAEVKTLPIMQGQSPVQIAKRAMEAAKLQGFDVVMLDTAGRLSIDEQLMAEVAEVHGVAQPAETLLVLDALTGQDAVETATRFKARVPVTGVVLTRLDGDARGGAALSMRKVTGAPIKFAGVGEKLDALDAFDPERMAGRILGMGDIVGLVEKASEEIDQKKAEAAAKKLAKGQFDLDDLADQFAQMRKMGGMNAIMGLMPGMGKLKGAVDAAGGFGDNQIRRQEAIISSMTKKERKNPKLLNASRKKRVAAGSGTSVQEVNKLLKAHQGMSTMMKKMGKGGKRGMAANMAKMLGGGMPGMPGGGAPGGAPNLPGLGGAPGDMPDLSKLGGLPGLGGPKKK
ncbi:signal recognition particle protein [Parvularcula oceani]|uniref:signal recognition particle protein n=1 Tax=Parvularcula oceani TaxID=1247963 RepID=UPI0004E281B8|nr:signal recognition particle protein [Parvularcula oceani]